jgi:hypothetical protein
MNTTVNHKINAARVEKCAWNENEKLANTTKEELLHFILSPFIIKPLIK